MADHVSTPLPAQVDALQRAARTLWQGIGVDAVATIGAGTIVLVNGGDVMSPIFWSGIAALVVKSVVMSAASYMSRLKLPPAGSATE